MVEAKVGKMGHESAANLVAWRARLAAGTMVPWMAAMQVVWSG